MAGISPNLSLSAPRVVVPVKPEVKAAEETKIQQQRQEQKQQIEQTLNQQTAVKTPTQGQTQGLQQQAVSYFVPNQGQGQKQTGNATQTNRRDNTRQNGRVAQGQQQTATAEESKETRLNALIYAGRAGSIYLGDNAQTLSLMTAAFNTKETDEAKKLDDIDKAYPEEDEDSESPKAQANGTKSGGKATLSNAAPKKPPVQQRVPLPILLKQVKYSLGNPAAVNAYGNTKAYMADVA